MNICVDSPVHMYRPVAGMSTCDPCDDVLCDTLGEPPTSWLRETSSTSNTARAGDSKCRQHQQKTTAESLKQLRC